MRRFLPLVALSLTIAAGCQQFFTSSVATALARPPQKITTLSAASATTFAETLAQNPDPAIAATALSALSALIAPSANPSAATITAAAQVAVIASGLDSALTQSIASVNLSAITSGTAPTSQELQQISTIIGTASTSLTGASATASAAIFASLAQTASTPAGAQSLKDSGIGAQTLVVAATSVAITEINTRLAALNPNPALPPKTIADVIADPVATPMPTMSAATTTELSNLAAGLQAVDPTNQLLGTLKTVLNLKF